MQGAQPDNTDPIPLRHSPHNVTTLLVRFVALLLTAIALMTLVWSR